jgi:hypothetical protein
VTGAGAFALAGVFLGAVFVVLGFWVAAKDVTPHSRAIDTIPTHTRLA